MSKTLDARGWACPKPVLETKKALQTESMLTVIVDNRAAKENVSRLADKAGHRFQVEQKEEDFYIHIEKSDVSPVHEEAEKETELDIQCTTGKLVLYISSDTVGQGSDELGGILMRAFMHTFMEIEPRPDTIIFMNNGVKLAVSGSPVLEDLQSLANEGVEILVCGTCLNYFEITDDVSVGEISNAYTIAETLLQADKVVRL